MHRFIRPLTSVRFVTLIPWCVLAAGCPGPDAPALFFTPTPLTGVGAMTCEVRTARTPEACREWPGPLPACGSFPAEQTQVTAFIGDAVCFRSVLCASSLARSPYTFSWMFGDGQNALPPPVTDTRSIVAHVFGTTGDRQGSVMVTDTASRTSDRSCPLVRVRPRDAPAAAGTGSNGLGGNRDVK